jgi:hypothetical protein
MDALSIEDALDVAAAGEQRGAFRAVEVTNWAGYRLDGEELRQEIDRRRA